MKILSLVGARPQFIKEALLGEAARGLGAWEHIVVHSGQHYDSNMSDIFFQELSIPQPAYHLGIGSGSHGNMTAAALIAIEQVLINEKPAALIVYGDTNTTLAGAIAAVKLNIPIVHVEAGIRQEPRSMPEESNRILTDHATAASNGLLCCCSQSAVQNLGREGIRNGVTTSGDVMFDLFLRMRHKFTPEEVCKHYQLTPNQFFLVTLHRDFNVDSSEALFKILQGLNQLAKTTGLTIFFPMHPRTKKCIEENNFQYLTSNFIMEKPIGYMELMSSLCASAGVLTDSGGLQKEAFFAHKRAIVLMPDTGWREITDCGWNLLVAPDADAILHAGMNLLTSVPHPGNLYGNGDAAVNIVNFISRNITPGLRKRF